MTGKKKHGFTLIELMIVMTIIGILISVTLPQMMKTRYQALFTVCQMNLRNMAAALEVYWVDNDHKYPEGSLVPLTTNKYIQKIYCPTDPLKQDYGYDVNNSEKAYTLWCMGRHLGVSGLKPANYPKYDNRSGIILEP